MGCRIPGLTVPYLLDRQGKQVGLIPRQLPIKAGWRDVPYENILGTLLEHSHSQIWKHSHYWRLKHRHLEQEKDNGNYLSDLCNAFSLKNLITDITCVKSTNGTSIDVLLTNKSRCFHHTATFETGLSNCHKLKNLLHSSRLTLRNFLRKILNIGTTKTLTKIIFFTNLAKNLAKGLSVRKNIISMMSLQIFVEWFLINMLK